MDWPTAHRLVVFLLFAAGTLANVALILRHYNGYTVPRLLICAHGATLFGFLFCRELGWACAKFSVEFVNAWSRTLYLHIAFTLVGVGVASLRIRRAGS